MTAATVVRGVVSAEALRNPRAALRVIEAHLATDLSGRCSSCQEMAPCSQLALGYVGLHGTTVLPRREPGRLMASSTTFSGFDDKRLQGT